MNERVQVSRRAAMGVMTGALLAGRAVGQVEGAGQLAFTGRVKQSVSRWCYGGIPMEEFCEQVRAIGITGIDLLEPPEWAVAQAHGLTCPMCNGPGGIARGWNDARNHDELVAKGEERLQQVADAGLPNMIVLSGNRRGISDEDGITNCVKGLKRIMPLAEKLGVNVVMELLNSKRDHKDYHCDRTAWGVELAKRIESDRFKLLYDIYHMQIMEGDVIATIQENIGYIGHIHTGGVPGRHEIDESQELNYPRIIQALMDAGFQGYVAHEFTPAREPMESLKQAVLICDV